MSKPMTKKEWFDYLEKTWDAVQEKTWAEQIQALRQALAQPEQEPVAGMFDEKLPDQNPPPWVRNYKAEEKT